ncbi:MAG TPA: hypothetical protein VE978_10075 [Chitinophagales bacterium]|nr:hypothetical protein [Chitinophagales bacterium]
MKKPSVKKPSAKKPLAKKASAIKPKSVKRVEKKKAVEQKKPAEKKIHVEKKKPVEKKEVPLTQEKIDLVRQAIITILWRKENVPVEQLRQDAVSEIPFNAGDEFPRYFDHVIEMLTKYNLIETVPDKTPPHIRLSQKLDV